MSERRVRGTMAGGAAGGGDQDTRARVAVRGVENVGAAGFIEVIKRCGVAVYDERTARPRERCGVAQRRRDPQLVDETFEGERRGGIMLVGAEDQERIVGVRIQMRRVV